MLTNRRTGDVPSPLSCDECGLTLLGIEALGPEPLDHEECPECGGTDFSF